MGMCPTWVIARSAQTATLWGRRGNPISHNWKNALIEMCECD